MCGITFRMFIIEMVVCTFPFVINGNIETVCICVKLYGFLSLGYYKGNNPYLIQAILLRSLHTYIHTFYASGTIVTAAVIVSNVPAIRLMTARFVLLLFTLLYDSYTLMICGIFQIRLPEIIIK